MDYHLENRNDADRSLVGLHALLIDGRKLTSAKTEPSEEPSMQLPEA